MKKTPLIQPVILAIATGALFHAAPPAAAAAAAQTHTLTVRADAPGKPISPDLFGIFFEDINYSADGGLYAELIQNRSFQYSPLDNPEWTAFSFWDLIKRGKASGGWALEAAAPLHPDNPHYLVLETTNPGDGFGVSNPGFDGIAVKAGETYDVSFFARQLYMDRRWARRDRIDTKPMPVTVRLETKDGEVLCEAPLQIETAGWKRFTATLVPARTDDNARFILLMKAAGGLALDEISLFPRNTFRNHPNGLRADLAQIIADMHPKFIRFPGGCLAHGNGLVNMYRWKDTIGPIEQRRGQPNIWRYHQSAGIGYFEYFQFCEDIGAKPLPILPAAVSCQNSDHQGGTGQQCIPMEDMPAYIQEVLDLIEWANGPVTSTWGAKRAAAGHPAPFNLEYIGIGNEDAITPGFKERFKMILEAVRQKHPEITVIGTVGPSPAGRDFDEGWKFARELRVPIVDEHYYEPPRWFLDNFHRYDGYDRAGPHVYIGEYAAHDAGRKSTLRSALAEAAYMTQLERNGDVVRLASYAPLLAKIGRTQWTPDLIYFTNTKVYPTINYHVQKLFATNSGDTYLETDINDSATAGTLATSAVRDSKTGDLILKLVNTGTAAQPLTIKLAGANAKSFAPEAALTVLTGDPAAENTPANPAPILPRTVQIQIAETFPYEAPPNSLTVIRLRTTP